MKRFLAVVILSLVVVQLCLLPLAVSALDPVLPCPSVVTLPVTNITNHTATLNGSVTIPGWAKLAVPDGVAPASLQYVIEGITVSFRYGTVPGVYAFETTAIPVNESRTFLTNIIGLSPCTTYYVQAKVTGTPPAIFNQFDDGLKGAGVGLDYKNLQQLFNAPCSDSYGSVVTFQTTGCQVGTGAPISHGAGGQGTTNSYSPPASITNIQTQSASLSAKTVTPGTPIAVTADIANKGTANGSKKVTVYINGQVETTQGVTVNSGGSTKLTFNVSRSEPGDYAVYVDGVPAGSFKVELFRESDGILIFSATLVALAFVAGMIMLWRRQRAVPS